MSDIKEPEMYSLVYLKLKEVEEHQCEKLVCEICGKSVEGCDICCDLDRITKLHDESGERLDKICDAIIAFNIVSPDDNEEDRATSIICSPGCLSIAHKTSCL